MDASVVSRIPSSLRQLPGWLVWRFEGGEDGAKPRKTPYYHNAGRRLGKNGSIEDRQQLTTFGAAYQACLDRDMTGVGLAMLSDWNLTALDFDNCVDADGGLPEEIERIAARS